MNRDEHDCAARVIGFLEGFSAWVWDNVGEHLADELADGYDRRAGGHVFHVRTLDLGQEFREIASQLDSIATILS